MPGYTAVLESLINELLSEDKRLELATVLASDPFDYNGFYHFDLQLSGPSVKLINDEKRIGRYHIEDRDILRPIQYLDMFFDRAQDANDLTWYAREIVQMSCLHIEGLIKGISKTPYLPLGQALRKPLAVHTLPPQLWDQLIRFVPIYNAAKHEFSQPKDSHLFSSQDAVMAYIVARLLGLRLYPFASLKTDLAFFDADVSNAPDS